MIRFLIATFIFISTAHAEPKEGDKAELKPSEGAVPTMKMKARTKPSYDVQLKLAKLWGRIDELEIKLKKQEEKIQILEKGLMLGVIPEELLRDKLNLSVEQAPPMDWPKSKVEEDVPKKSPEAHKGVVEHKASKPYSQLVREAQDLFGAGNYGRAISIYQEIQKSYPVRNREGQSYYWIGLSWYYLKEYDLAEKNFKLLESMAPNSPWLGNAQLHQGKILANKGLFQRAIKVYQKLIEVYPDSDTSEMAVREIQVIRERI